VIKKFRFEIIVLAVLLINIFISYNIDIGFYNLFNNLNSSFNNIYLKEFFVEITILGSSMWYFIFSVLVVILGFLLRGNKKFNKYKKTIDVHICFGIFLFTSLFVGGFLTQSIKHIVGRPRPNYTTLEENIGFNFFNINSEFHSFPSGHASTIFLVALTIIYFLPKLKYFMLVFAGIIAFSRVVVGAHFFTDIIGGAAVAYLTTKLVVLLLKKYNLINLTKIKKDTMIVINYWSGDTKIYYLFLVFFFLILILTIGHSIDIYFSGLFYYKENQFLLQSYYDITIFFRKIVLRAIIIYILILPIISLWLPISQLYFNFKFNLKEILFIWSTSFINVLIIVNLLLKNLWGRARPGDVLELGGKESFSPWFQISDSCSTNCSFVSGDAAVGFSIIALYFITKNKFYLWSSLVLGASLGMIRIMEGGHFLSDVVMSAAIIYFAYFLQTKFFYKRYD
tara:strand:+ start:4711 stop:6066 length:1356 start_codon:yes stop_codon:yes gene_type:complete